MFLLLACAEEAPPAPTGPVLSERPWPTTAAESPAPAGTTWQTLRHTRVQARVLVPDGAVVTSSDEETKDDEPFIRIQWGSLRADLTYEPSSAFYAAEAPANARRAGETLIWQTEQPEGGVKVTGLARGLRCTAVLGAFDRSWIDAAFQLCGSIRPAPLGTWGPAPGQGNTQVPEGAWVEPRRPEMLGESLLGPYAPRLYAGWFAVAHAHCPADPTTLGTATGTETAVTLQQRETSMGPATIRRSRATRGGVTFDAGARVVAPRGDGCCVAEVFPLFEGPSDAEIDYVLALCDTTTFPVGKE